MTHMGGRAALHWWKKSALAGVVLLLSVIYFHRLFPLTHFCCISCRSATSLILASGVVVEERRAYLSMGGSDKIGREKTGGQKCSRLFFNGVPLRSKCGQHGKRSATANLTAVAKGHDEKWTPCI
ncbi:hypothetical protein BKA80DRAFT_269195 [Phyllosticta citrichinensis]